MAVAITLQCAQTVRGDMLSAINLVELQVLNILAIPLAQRCPKFIN